MEPGGQPAHAENPSPATDPYAHGAHEELAMAPTPASAVPASHSVHLLAPDAEAYDPEGHSTQEEDEGERAYDPGRH